MNHESLLLSIALPMAYKALERPNNLSSGVDGHACVTDMADSGLPVRGVTSNQSRGSSENQASPAQFTLDVVAESGLVPRKGKRACRRVHSAESTCQASNSTDFRVRLPATSTLSQQPARALAGTITSRTRSRNTMDEANDAPLSESQECKGHGACMKIAILSESVVGGKEAVSL